VSHNSNGGTSELREGIDVRRTRKRGGGGPKPENHKNKTKRGKTGGTQGGT